MVEQEQGKKFRSDEELKEYIEIFRKRLKILNEMCTIIHNNGIGSDFYIGPNLSYTYLPDKVVFTRRTTEKF